MPRDPADEWSECMKLRNVEDKHVGLGERSPTGHVQADAGSSVIHSKGQAIQRNVTLLVWCTAVGISTTHYCHCHYHYHHYHYYYHYQYYHCHCQWLRGTGYWVLGRVLPGGCWLPLPLRSLPLTLNYRQIPSCWRHTTHDPTWPPSSQDQTREVLYDPLSL